MTKATDIETAANMLRGLRQTMALLRKARDGQIVKLQVSDTEDLIARWNNTQHVPERVIRQTVINELAKKARTQAAELESLGVTELDAFLVEEMQ